MENIVKYFIGLLTVIILRLSPHPPNIEPIMTTMMPFAKKWGSFAAFIFTSLSILLFDLITGTFGNWSFFTIGSYGLLGILAGLYFTKKRNKTRHYLAFAIFGTLLYDAITGIGMGVLIFKQSFVITLIGQIPFTLYHLAGNIFLSIVISPLLYHWIIDNRKLDLSYILNKIANRSKI